MSGLKSLRIGLSKSYHSLNDLGDDIPGSNDTPFFSPSGEPEDYHSLDENRMPKPRGNKRINAIKSALHRLTRATKIRPPPIFNITRGGRKLGVRSQSVIDVVEGAVDRELMGRLRNSSSNRMPSTMAVPAEQVSPLLGNYTGETSEEVELRNVQLTLASPRSLTEDGSAGTKETVETKHGPITIAVSGDRSKHVVLTYHDLGLNHVTNFQNFFQFPDAKNLFNQFCVVHVNAPGQELDAHTLPENYVYPNMDELADMITAVKDHVGFRSFFGFGVGLGANVLVRYALQYPQDVDCLALINCSSTQTGWMEWGCQKLNIHHLKSNKMTVSTVNYLLWHHFGKLESCNQDLLTVYRQQFEKSLNATNLGHLIEIYIKRSDLGIVRELDPNKKKDVKMIRCPVLNITSNFSPHIDDTVTFNSRLDPSNSTWMKVQDCGLVIDECPAKVVEAFRLFLQGLGYAVSSNSRRASSISIECKK